MYYENRTEGLGDYLCAECKEPIIRGTGPVCHSCAYPTMPLSEILNLCSGESAGGFGLFDSDRRVHDIIWTNYRYMDYKTSRYEELYRSMQECGQTYPIQIASAKQISAECGFEVFGNDANLLCLGQGHTRVKIACQLGWKEMCYTSDYRKTGERQ